MWLKEPTLGQFTSETDQHELNLAFHYAMELRTWFPWLDCDCDVRKANLDGKRPDIILHRRGSRMNFLVIEVKREIYSQGINDDLNKIRNSWFEERFKYRYGAGLILNDREPRFEVHMICRSDNEKVSLKHSGKRRHLYAPAFSPRQIASLRRSVDRIAKELDAGADVRELERKLDERVATLYGL